MQKTFEIPKLGQIILKHSLDHSKIFPCIISFAINVHKVCSLHFNSTYNVTYSYNFDLIWLLTVKLSDLKAANECGNPLKFYKLGLSKLISWLAWFYMQQSSKHLFFKLKCAFKEIWCNNADYIFFLKTLIIMIKLIRFT